MNKILTILLVVLLLACGKRKEVIEVLHILDAFSQVELNSTFDVYLVEDSSYSTDNFQTGIHFSQTVVYRKFRFTLQEGVYVGLTNKIQSSMYNRGILKYYINDDFSVRLAMKSHLHLLDYPEIGFGYKF